MTADEAKSLLRERRRRRPHGRGVRAAASTRSRPSRSGTDARLRRSRPRRHSRCPARSNLFVVADNLRKGAALNAVQIAERLFADDLVRVP